MPQLYAQEKITVDRWQILSQGLTTETYTSSDAAGTFGMFCTGEKCVFYLHHSITCQPNARYSVLLNSQSVSTAISMKCTLVGKDLFWILSPFDALLKAVQVGDQIGFAVALQSGEFAVSKYSLSGAKKAINDSLVMAAKKKIIPKVTPNPPSDSNKTVPKSSPKDLSA